MTTHLARLLVVACALALPAACARGAVSTPAPAAPSAAPRVAAQTTGPGPHVVIISIDGLRPDAIERSDARTLRRLMREGSYALGARTITPSVTLPSHASMLTGLGPDQHGITWNRNRMDSRGVISVPTLFSIARAHGLATAAFFGKGKFRHLMRRGSLDHAAVPAGDASWSADKVSSQVASYLAGAAPHLLFVHLSDPDRAGHHFSWMSLPYRRAVRRADAAVERVLAAAERAYGAGAYTVIVTADHGGHGWVHGTRDARDVTIPWIAWGRGVRPGGVIAEAVHTTDTTPTALWLLGLDMPGTHPGQPVASAFLPVESAADEARSGTR